MKNNNSVFDLHINSEQENLTQNQGKNKIQDKIFRFILGTEPKYCKNIKIERFDIYPRAVFGQNFETCEKYRFQFYEKLQNFLFEFLKNI